jgi:predicted permease
MFTFKNVSAVALFLFGTTFLWLTPEFLGRSRDVEGVIWTAVQLLVWVALIGFAAAAWGVFEEAPWWEPVAIGSAIAGIVSLVPYGIGAAQLAGVPNVASNLAIHAAGSAAVLALVLVPAVHAWFTGRLS